MDKVNEVEVSKDELEWFTNSNIYKAFCLWASMRRKVIMDQITSINKTPDIGNVRYMQGELAQLEIWERLPQYLLERLTPKGEAENGT